MSLALVAPPPDLAPDPAPPLRSLLVGAAQRAHLPHARARELAPGLHEVVAILGPDGPEIPHHDELRRLIADADPFPRARAATCDQTLEFGRAGPAPGVHAYILGGPGQPDTAVAALALADDLAHVLGPAGLVLAVPVRGMALFVAPGAHGLCRALTRFGTQRLFWTSAPPRPDIPAPVGPLACARAALAFLATWTANAHARFPDPVSPALYWHRPHAGPEGREAGDHTLAVLVADARKPGALSDELLHRVLGPL